MWDKLTTIQRTGELGYFQFPCRKSSKIPCFQGWQQKASREPLQLREWFDRKNHNVGLPTGIRNKLVVLDFDNLEEGRAFFKKQRDILQTIVSTPRGGVHCFFQYPDFEVRNASDRKRKTDLRGEGGYVVCPPSEIGDTAYRFVEGHELVPAHELPVFNREYWPKFRDQRFAPSRIVAGNSHDFAVLRRRALSYVLKIQSISGERGHDACFRVVCKLRDFGLSPEEAWLCLNEWNRTNAYPQWSVENLWHKHQDVFYKQTHNQ